MDLHKNKRFFKFFEIELRAARQQGPALQMKAPGATRDVIDIIIATIGKANAALSLNADETVRLTKCERIGSSNIYALLFRKRDEAIAAQVYEHSKTAGLRQASKNADEAASVSSHCFVEIVENGAGSSRYRTIVEEVPGLGVSYMQSILQKVLSEEYTYKDGAMKQHKTYTIIRFKGYKSETLTSVLNGGSVSFIQLTRITKPSGLDLAYFTPKQESMKIRLTPLARNALIKNIDKLKDWAFSNDWADFKVSVTSVEKRSKLVDVDRNESAAQAVLIRNKQITFKVELPTCTDVVLKPTCDAAIKEFVASW